MRAWWDQEVIRIWHLLMRMWQDQQKIEMYCHLLYSIPTFLPFFLTWPLFPHHFLPFSFLFKSTLALLHLLSCIFNMRSSVTRSVVIKQQITSSAFPPPFFPPLVHWLTSPFPSPPLSPSSIVHLQYLAPFASHFVSSPLPAYHLFFRSPPPSSVSFGSRPFPSALWLSTGGVTFTLENCWSNSPSQPVMRQKIERGEIRLKRMRHLEKKVWWKKKRWWQKAHRSEEEKTNRKFEEAHKLLYESHLKHHNEQQINK